MKAGRLPLRVSACLALAGLLVGLLAVPSALADGAPTINSFSPSSGPVGTSVTINGTNLTGATWVKFNGVMATITSNTATQIVTEVPMGATTGPITAKTTSGTATSPTNFIVTTTAAPPTISSFSPKSGPVGTAVQINGSGFVAGATAVQFNGVSASPVTVNSQGTRIDTKVPTGATTGKITVTTPGGTDTSKASFTVTIPAPTISSFSPTSGRTGTAVTITGTSFTGATAVRFGGVRASFVVNSATQITATVPVGAVTGKISITTPGGTGTSAMTFTVVPTFHSRSISISLRRHLVVRGTVSAGGFDACAEDALVRIRRFADGAWRTIATTHTNDDGFYRVRVPDRPGRYRALAPRETLGDSDICGRALSRVAFNA
jgi:hypothetical protein